MATLTANNSTNPLSHAVYVMSVWRKIVPCILESVLQSLIETICDFLKIRPLVGQCQYFSESNEIFFSDLHVYSIK